jgi:nitrate reductase molybdenum cofactor assembly chaperone NarJ/NarW
MNKRDISAAYRLLAELFVNPSQRDNASLSIWLEQTKSNMVDVAEQVDRFMKSDGAISSHEYVSTLELSPPCPLYLGAHMFEEPSTCSGISTSPRNAFMLELSGMYEHFGFDLGSVEMPDYLPVMLEFMALSLENEHRDKLGLRRRLIEKYLLAGMAPLARGFAKFESIYGLLIPAIELVAAEDLQLIGDVPMWQPNDQEKGTVSLEVLSTQKAEPVLDMHEPEVRP